MYTIDTKKTSEVGPLNIKQGQSFNELLKEFASLFANDISELGRTDLVIHRIYTENIPSIKS